MKELIDISVKNATTFTEKSCDQTGLHPFVVVEGLDATGTLPISKSYIEIFMTQYFGGIAHLFCIMKDECE